MGLLLLALTFVTLHAPHVARAPRAVMDAELTRSVDAATAKDAAALSESMLAFTDAHLHFGLAHRTSLKFSNADREGNCIEYAELFAAAFNRAANRLHIAERAWVMHSDARVLGGHIGQPGLDDHDWVLVVPTSGAGPRKLIDPTFHDMGLDADIASIVKGDVRVP